MPEKKPIPTAALYPVAFACVVIVALVLLGAPDLVLVPIAAITVLWIAVMVVRNNIGKGA